MEFEYIYGDKERKIVELENVTIRPANQKEVTYK